MGITYFLSYILLNIFGGQIVIYIWFLRWYFLNRSEEEVGVWQICQKILLAFFGKFVKKNDVGVFWQICQKILFEFLVNLSKDTVGVFWQFCQKKMFEFLLNLSKDTVGVFLANLSKNTVGVFDKFVKKYCWIFFGKFVKLLLLAGTLLHESVNSTLNLLDFCPINHILFHINVSIFLFNLIG